jgi:hypothetical protein
MACVHAPQRCHRRHGCAAATHLTRAGLPAAAAAACPQRRRDLPAAGETACGRRSPAHVAAGPDACSSRRGACCGRRGTANPTSATARNPTRASAACRGRGANGIQNAVPHASRCRRRRGCFSLARSCRGGGAGCAPGASDVAHRASGETLTTRSGALLHQTRRLPLTNCQVPSLPGQRP